MSPVIHTSREELEQQREQMLEQVRLSYDQLRERAETYSLSPDEMDVWHSIEGIDYLLNGDHS